MANKIVNPIIPGNYPDPTIQRVGDDYYICCSSFELCPGLPIFHSRDLVNWEQISYALTPDNGFHVERNGGVGGIMAPTLRYHNGTWYILNANFCDKGNFFITAKDPKGPWSAPHFLDDIPGIDASFFFDNDGKCYVCGTGMVWDNGAGGKERGIWVAEYDIENFKVIGEPFTIFANALRVATSPEAPHLYHIGDYYYLMIAEGGTEHYHSVVVARSRELFSVFEGNPANPVLTHRHMGFKAPIINVGHADLVELPDGSWYAVFLGSRLIEGECKNLGRETFLCPVIWERDWPVFTPETGKVEWEYDAPSCLPWTPCTPEAARDDFDREEPALYWNFWGTPYQKFHEIRDSKLILDCISQNPADEVIHAGFVPQYRKDKFVSGLFRRQRQIRQTAAAKMVFSPKGNETAGLAVVQAIGHQYHIERACEDGKQVVRVVQYTNDFHIPPFVPLYDGKSIREVIAVMPWESDEIVIRIELDGEEYRVQVGSSDEELTTMAVLDGRVIDPEKCGCMAGTLLGMFASGNGADSENKAEFDWFELR